MVNQLADICVLALQARSTHLALIDSGPLSRTRLFACHIPERGNFDLGFSFSVMLEALGNVSHSTVLQPISCQESDWLASVTCALDERRPIVVSGFDKTTLEVAASLKLRISVEQGNCILLTFRYGPSHSFIFQKNLTPHLAIIGQSRP